MSLMPYRVQILPQPIVIDANGFPVATSHVVEIIFPSDTIETILGRVNTIVEPDSAKILVGDAPIRGVTLC
jgi:hypothetical protein